MVRDFGDPVQDLKGELISRKVVSAEERTNRLLQIDPDQPLLEIRRLIYLRRKPVVLAISRLPQGMFPGLERLPDAEMIDTPLYLILENYFGRPTIANHELFSVARADSMVRRHLGVARNHPVLQIEMLSMTYKGQPYEHRISYCRSEAERIFRII
jgi:GntR family frlABCD operon transcriptional regulator